MPPKADVQRLDTDPELLADFGRKGNVRFPACCAEKQTLRLPTLVDRFGPMWIRGF